MSAAGVSQLKALFEELSGAEGFRKMRLADLFRILVEHGRKVEVVYVRGHWLDVDDMHDVVAASNFGGSGQYR
jgi:NDP-sugar pyrophosphorylase family protein